MANLMMVWRVRVFILWRPGGFDEVIGYRCTGSETLVRGHTLETNHTERKDQTRYTAKARTPEIGGKGETTCQS